MKLEMKCPSASVKEVTNMDNVLLKGIITILCNIVMLKCKIEFFLITKFC